MSVPAGAPPAAEAYARALTIFDRRLFDDAALLFPHLTPEAAAVAVLDLARVTPAELTRMGVRA